MKRNIIRILIVAGFVAVAFLLFVFGKQYEILIDNKAATVNGTEYAAEYAINYSFDGNDAEELKVKKRKKAYVVGPNHTVKAEYTDSNGKSIVVEKNFSLAIQEGTLIANLAVLIEGSDDWLVRE